MRGILLAGLLLMGVFCQAQQLKVEETEQKLNEVVRRGQQLTLQLDRAFVEKYWKEYLQQEAGKVKYSKGIYTIEHALIDTISNSPIRVLSTVGSGAGGTYVWWCLDMGTAYVSKTATPEIYASAENFLKAFGQQVHRQDVFEQINAAEEELRAAKAEQERVAREAGSIQLSIEKNKQRRLELEAELRRNAEELQQLELNVVHNLKQQEVSRERVTEMEKAVEVVRAKLRNIVSLVL